MRRIAGAALAGWLAIVGLAWVLADRRIAICPPINAYSNAADVACVVRGTAARDGVLTHGLTVALVMVVVGLLWAGTRHAGMPVKGRPLLAAVGSS
ncbi:MAG: hypothetical protein ACKOUT_13290 [Novosphingobium sp.]